MKTVTHVSLSPELKSVLTPRELLNMMVYVAQVDLKKLAAQNPKEGTRLSVTVSASRATELCN